MIPRICMVTKFKLVLPRRRSLALWALLALGFVVFSYLFVLLLAAACVYIPFFLLSHSEGPSFQTIIVLIAGIAMSGTMLWSLLPRRDQFQPPGPLVDRPSHPRLFSELDAIAASLNEPLPAEVYLIREVNAFVSDRGGILGFGSRRVMGLGLPLLSILRVSEFRAVLAHEFAHYYGGDTRLGPWVYKTRMAMVRTIENMASIRRVMRWGLAVLVYRVVMSILQGYWKLFFRSTQMISRRQEYRADELACHIAGSSALSDGLRKINGDGSAFSFYWNSEILPVLRSGYRLPVSEGFHQFVAAPAIAVQIEQHLNKVLKEEKVHPYDSHPPLRDRLAAIAALPPQPAVQDTALATSLLSNVMEEEAKLLQMSSKDEDVSKLMPIGWEQLPVSMIKTWMEVVRQNAQLLGDITAESLPEALAKLPEMGGQMADPPGMLLSPQQRTARAAELLGVAMALALVEAGWVLQAKPGEHSFRSGDEQISVRKMINDLMEKRITPEGWRERCRSLRVSDVRLGEVAQNQTISP